MALTIINLKVNGDCFAEDALADASFEALCCYRVDRSAEQIRQVHDQSAEIEQAPAWLQVDEEIDVAARVGFARATEPNTRTLWAPRRSATSTICSRRSAISSAVP